MCPMCLGLESQFEKKSRKNVRILKVLHLLKETVHPRSVKNNVDMAAFSPWDTDMVTVVKDIFFPPLPLFLKTKNKHQTTGTRNEGRSCHN